MFLDVVFFGLQVTNRRVNALENVVKPRLENTISYIKGELDELEREEFFRLKKVQVRLSLVPLYCRKGSACCTQRLVCSIVSVSGH